MAASELSELTSFFSKATQMPRCCSSSLLSSLVLLLVLAATWLCLPTTPSVVGQTPMYFARHASKAIAGQLASSAHLIVLGPSGVGKTTAVLEACNHPPPETYLLPFYVNLASNIQPGGGLLSDDVAWRNATLKAFAEEARAFESRLLLPLESDLLSSMLLGYIPAWLSRKSVAAVHSIADHAVAEESLFGLLTRMQDVALRKAWLYSFTSSRSVVPVLIIDEIHHLESVALAPLKRSLLRFVHNHVKDKDAARVVVVLLSSDAQAEAVVGSCVHPRVCLSMPPSLF